MSRFMTRVELHGANSKDYETLHTAMAGEGFSPFIQAGDGTVYRLPTAEYYCEGNFTAAQVLQAAQRSANKTGRNAGIIVSETTMSTWNGLDPVKTKSFAGR